MVGVIMVVTYYILSGHDGQLTNNLVPKYGSLRNAVRSIYQTEGLPGFTKGLMVSFWANASARSLFFYW